MQLEQPWPIKEATQKLEMEKQHGFLQGCSVPQTCQEPSMLTSLETVIAQWQQHLNQEAK